jgi:hypothetical protein
MNAMETPGSVIGTIVCEPQINRTAYTIEGTDEATAPGQVLLAPLDMRRRRDRSTWYYSFPEHLEIIGRLQPVPRRSIRHLLKYDRKAKVRMPFGPKVGGGAEAHTVWCIRDAISHREDARKQRAKAAILADLNDGRGARIARLAASEHRRRMRHAALWARVWADHLPDQDQRLVTLSQQSHDLLSRSFRAGNLSDRWRRIQVMKIAPRMDDATRERIDGVLRRIAAKHAALDPHGYTLPST